MYTYKTYYRNRLPFMLLDVIDNKRAKQTQILVFPNEKNRQM